MQRLTACVPPLREQSFSPKSPELGAAVDGVCFPAQRAVFLAEESGARCTSGTVVSLKVDHWRVVFGEEISVVVRETTIWQQYAFSKIRPNR